MTTKPAIPIKTATCPICNQPRAVFHDMHGTTYFTRHQQAGRSTWCAKSSKPVKDGKR